MTQREPVLSVKNLCKRIGGREIVKDIQFDVFPGEIFGFLGPNGAGKTTTIRMLVGLIRPTGGTVHIAGHNLQKDFLKAIRHVGCIVENPEMYAFLSGRENLEHFARMAEDIPPERIDEVIRLVELEKRIDDKVKTYSLGMRQRLGIAQALLGRPKLLILDEPTNGLDPAGIRELRDFIRKLAREEGIGVFISSHILHEVQLMCDRVAIISRGRLLKTDRVDRLVDGDSLVVEWMLDPPERGAELLEDLPYVSNVERRENHIFSQLPEERIGETVRMMVDAGILVSGIHRRRKTLEDIFLQMTEGDPIA
ncbi:MAG: ABC transporter ATP-binding protein [Planifilum fimeticola]|jgi:ABC-2 type transport system ATP-binding protein